MKRLMLLALVAATAAVAGPYDQPYSIITTDTAPSADPLLRPVIVNRVNDETISSDNRAVDKIVQTVGEQIHVADWMDAVTGFEHVLMAPQKKFLEAEKGKNSGKDGKRGLHLLR